MTTEITTKRVTGPHSLAPLHPSVSQYWQNFNGDSGGICVQFSLNVSTYAAQPRITAVTLDDGSSEQINNINIE